MERDLVKVVIFEIGIEELGLGFGDYIEKGGRWPRRWKRELRARGFWFGSYVRYRIL